MLNLQGIVHFGIDFEWLLHPHFTFNQTIKDSQRLPVGRPVLPSSHVPM